MLAFVDRMAREQSRNRGLVVNSILRWYAKWLEEQHEVGMLERKVPVIEV